MRTTSYHRQLATLDREVIVEGTERRTTIPKTRGTWTILYLLGGTVDALARRMAGARRRPSWHLGASIGTGSCISPNVATRIRQDVTTQILLGEDARIVGVGDPSDSRGSGATSGTRRSRRASTTANARPRSQHWAPRP